MNKTNHLARWAGIILCLSLLTWIASDLAAKLVAERHESQVQGDAREQAQQALTLTERQLSATFINLYKRSAAPKLVQSLRRFEQSGDYQAQFSLTQSLSSLGAEMPWPGTLSITDSKKLVIASTTNNRIGKTLKAPRWQQPIESLPGAEIAYLNRQVYLRIPITPRGVVLGHMEYIFEASELGQALQSLAANFKRDDSLRATLELDGEEGLIRVARLVTGQQQDADGSWTTVQVHSRTLPLLATFERPNLQGALAAARIRSAGEILAVLGMLAAMIMMILHAVAPYLHGIHLLRSMRSHHAEEEPATGTHVQGHAGDRPPSERMAYDILATHHVLEEVLSEHTRELEKLYRVLNDEHRRRDQAEKSMQEAQARFHEAVESSSEAIWEWTPGNELQSWLAESFYEWTGLRPEEFPGKLGDFVAAMVDRDAEHSAASMQQQLRFGNRFEIEFRLCTRIGQQRWFSTRGQVQRDVTGKVSRISGNIQDIQARKNAEAEVERLMLEMEHRARRDGLTELHNRESFMELGMAELDRAQRSGRPLALLMFDLDHFKRINDRYGHSIGDHALIRFAETLRHLTRASDICARIGGEEFVLLLPESNAATATELAERIRAQVSELTINAGNSGNLKITCSVGVSCLRESDDLERLMIRADRHMYEAKHMGRDRVCSEHDAQVA